MTDKERGFFRRPEDNDTDSSSSRKPFERRPYERRPMGSHDAPRSNRFPNKSFGDKNGPKPFGKFGDKKPFGKPFGKPFDRDKLPENLIFGIHPVREAIEAGKQIEKLYFRRPGEEGGSTNPAIAELREMAETAGIFIQEVPNERLDYLARQGNHQGVVGIIALVEYREINELLEELAAQVSATPPPLVVVMDSVTDIRNFGAIARSAECAGASAIILPAKNSAPVNAEALKSSAGALNLIPISRVGSLKGVLKQLHEIGFQCVAATEKSTTPIYSANLNHPTALVLGSEDQGISPDVLELCQQQVAIPLRGRIESLNVSAAAAVLFFEFRRQTS